MIHQIAKSKKPKTELTISYVEINLNKSDQFLRDALDRPEVVVGFINASLKDNVSRTEIYAQLEGLGIIVN